MKRTEDGRREGKDKKGRETKDDERHTVMKKRDDKGNTIRER